MPKVQHQKRKNSEKFVLEFNLFITFGQLINFKLIIS